VRRRLFLLLLTVATKAIDAAAMIQNSAPTNTPQCPLCRQATDGAHGWLIVSTQPNAVDPAVQTAIQVHVCPRCGLMYGAV
jgi:hypothetical protein